MKTSAIITVYNRPEMVAACLRALELNTILVDEVVVSDDGSDDANVQLMRRTFNDLKFPIRYVRQEHSGYRLAAARNNAIRAATGDYLISLDCDIILLPETVATHLRHAKKGLFLAGNRAMLDEVNTARVLTSLGRAGQPVPPLRTVGQGCPTLPGEGNVPFTNSALSPRLLEVIWEATDKKDMFNIRRRFRRNLLLRRIGLAAPHKPKILGCHFSLFREDVLKVNGFDEKFIGWGLEDDDFARRLYQAGLEGKSVIKEARALHLWHPPAGSKPQAIADSPNMAYFKRADVPFYCAKGLRKT